MSPRPRASLAISSAVLLAGLLNASGTAAPLAGPSGSIAAPFAPSIAAPVPRSRPQGSALTPATPSTADGQWREFDLLQVAQSITFYDAAHDELISAGGTHRDNWALPLHGAPEWNYLPGVSPYYAWRGSTAVDPSNGLLYDLAPPGGIRVSNPRAGTSTTLPILGTPPSNLDQGSMVHDPVGHRLIFTGAQYFGDAIRVFVFDLANLVWNEVATSGAPPADFNRYVAVFDPARARVIYPASYGGTSIAVLDLSGSPQWSVHPASSPNVPGANDYVHDPERDGVWTLDGLGDAHLLSLDTLRWSRVPAAAGPSGRQGAGLALDGVHHRLLVCGGVTPLGENSYSDVWALAIDGVPAWTRIVGEPLRIPRRGGASDVLDFARGRLILSGGAGYDGQLLNDTWALQLAPHPTWSEVATQGGPPAPRYWHAAAWDEIRDQMIVFGGYNGGAPPHGDLWKLSFGGGTPTWTQLTPAGPAPVARYGSQLVRDPIGDRFLLVHGTDDIGLLRDVWELKMTPTPTWRRLVPSNAGPTARGGMMCQFDTPRNRLLFFGGYDGTDYRGDLHALQFGTGDGSWQSLSTLNPPSGRVGGLLRYDALHNRLLLFGGYGIDPSFPDRITINYLGDVHALTLSGTLAWNALNPAGPRPQGRDRTHGVYDTAFDRLIVTGGDITSLNDVWELAFGETPTAVDLALVASDATEERVRLTWAGAEPGATLRIDRQVEGRGWNSLGSRFADGEGRLVFEDRDVERGATYEYRLGVVELEGDAYYGFARVHVPAHGLSLAATGTDGRITFAVELPGAEPASLDLFDLAGRTVWSRDLGARGAGRFRIDVEDAGLVPALYFARLTQGAGTRLARLVLVR